MTETEQKMIKNCDDCPLVLCLTSQSKDCQPWLPVPQPGLNSAQAFAGALWASALIPASTQVLHCP